MAKSKPYPTWICHPCGVQYGSWYKDGEYQGPKNHCSTMHYDTCGVCGKADVVVTEPRDYGHLIDGWDNKYKELNTKNAPASIQ